MKGGLLVKAPGGFICFSSHYRMFYFITHSMQSSILVFFVIAHQYAEGVIAINRKNFRSEFSACF